MEQHLVVPKSEQVLDKTCTNSKKSKGPGNPLKELSMEQSEQQSQVELAYNPKYKINNCEPLLI
jgi:hypothetical protein